MKANEEPKKLYYAPYGDIREDYPITDNDIEYVRKDAFIDKACEFLDGVIYDYIELKHANIDTFIDVDNKRFIEEFKNYMKGVMI